MTHKNFFHIGFFCSLMAGALLLLPALCYAQTLCAKSTRVMTGEQPKSLGVQFISSDNPTCQLTRAVINLGSGNTIDRTAGLTCVPNTHSWSGEGTSQATIVLNPPLNPGEGFSECIGDSLGFYWDSGQTISVTFACSTGNVAFTAPYDNYYDVITYKTFKISEASLGSCPPPDPDEDGVPDPQDNCPNTPNPNQEDDDSDGLGNVCDNCPSTSNADQTDSDGNGVGDACEPQCNDGKDNDGDGNIDFPDDSGCSSPDDDNESEDISACVSYLPRKQYPLFFQSIVRVQEETLPAFVQQHLQAAIATKLAVVRYIRCLEPSRIPGIEPPICLEGPITTGLPQICPPLDCLVDGPGCMDPYQFRRANVPDSVLTTVGLWSEHLISEKEFISTLKDMVNRGQIILEKERPRKIRYLPKIGIGMGMLLGLGLIVIGFAFNSLFRKIRK